MKFVREILPRPSKDQGILSNSKAAQVNAKAWRSPLEVQPCEVNDLDTLKDITANQPEEQRRLPEANHDQDNLPNAKSNRVHSLGLKFIQETPWSKANCRGISLLIRARSYNGQEPTIQTHRLSDTEPTKKKPSSHTSSGPAQNVYMLHVMSLLGVKINS